MTTCPSGVNYMHLVDQARVQDRTGIRQAADRAGVAGRAGVGAAAARIVSREHDSGAVGPAAGRLAAGFHSGLGIADFVAANQGDAGTCAGPFAGAGRGGRQRFSGPRRAARAGRIAAGLRPTGAGAADQSGRHQPADPPRHRGCAGQGRAMLRRADPSPRARRRRAGARARQHPRLARGGRRKRPRRHPGDDVGLRHGDQGLRVHAARGPRFRRPPPRRFRRWRRISPNMSAASICRRRSNAANSSSPITRPVRCSTDRKSRKLRKNCFPRTDSW